MSITQVRPTDIDAHTGAVESGIAARGRGEDPGVPSPDVPRRNRAAWFANLSVRVKILCVIATFAAVSAVSGIIAGTSLTSSADDFTEVATAQAEVVQPILGLKSNFNWAQGTFVRAMAAADDPATRDAFLADWADQVALVDDGVATLDPALAGSQNWQDFKTARAAYSELQRTVQLDAIRADDRAAFNRNYVDLVLPAAWDVANALDASIDEVVTEAGEHAARSESDATAATVLVVSFLVGGTAIATLIGLLVAAAVRRPIRRVEEALTALARGDLTVETGIESTDEVGRMAAALATAQHAVREVIGRVAGSSDAVATSAEQLSASSAKIAAASEESST